MINYTSDALTINYLIHIRLVFFIKHDKKNTLNYINYHTSLFLRYKIMFVRKLRVIRKTILERSL